MSDIHLQPNKIHTPQYHRKGRLVGQKPPLKPKEVWSIRIRLQILGKIRDLALFNLAIDSKLRSCDLVALRVSDVFVSGSVKERALGNGGYLFLSRVHDCLHLSTRQYARIVNQWVNCSGQVIPDTFFWGTKFNNSEIIFSSPPLIDCPNCSDVGGYPWHQCRKWRIYCSIVMKRIGLCHSVDRDGTERTTRAAHVR